MRTCCVWLMSASLTVVATLVIAVGATGCGSGGSGGTTGTTGGTTNAAGTTSVAGGTGGEGTTSSAGTTSTQHPFRAGSAACVDYPDIGYRVFPNEPFVAGQKRWPTCTLNCTTVQSRAGTAMSPLDQALPAGPCEDEGATCDSALMAGWCPPCANTGGPGNGYTCTCRAQMWHCALTSHGVNMCDAPTCVDSSAGDSSTSCYQTTWSTTEICACGTCRTLCTSDGDCQSGRCSPNQVCRAPDACAGPDECPASCTGLCTPAVTDGGGQIDALVSDAE
jgi:hypothetical protein